MSLINTEGLTILGDGSQWFWSMLAFLALPITGYAIYSQLRIARSARARDEIEGFDREWASERMMRYRLEVLTAIRDGVDSVNLPIGSAAGLCGFWDRIGELVREGHLDPGSLHRGYSRTCQVWWANLAPGLLPVRVARDAPDLYVDFEWLAGKMAELDRLRGLPGSYSATPIDLVDNIPMLEGQLRIEEALRSVTAASPNVLSAGQPRRRREGRAHP